MRVESYNREEKIRKYIQVRFSPYKENSKLYIYELDETNRPICEVGSTGRLFEKGHCLYGEKEVRVESKFSASQDDVLFTTGLENIRKICFVDVDVTFAKFYRSHDLHISGNVFANKIEYKLKCDNWLSFDNYFDLEKWATEKLLKHPQSTTVSIESKGSSVRFMAEDGEARSPLDSEIYGSSSDLNFWENNNLNDKKESKKMNFMKNFEFGEIKDEAIAVSLSGLAFRNADKDYIVYKSDGSAVNVSDMIFNVPLWKLPTSLAQIKKDDAIVLSNAWGGYGIVQEVKSHSIVVIKVSTQEIAEIVTAKSIFGFDYVTKVVNPLENMSASATETNPFGNLLPLMMMSDDKKSDSSILMAMTMMNGVDTNMNTMLPFLMMSKDGGSSKDFLMAMMMRNATNQITPEE